MAIEQEMIDIIVEQLSVEKEKVVPNASFVDDLGADSLDLVEDLIEAGYGVGLLPLGRRTRPAVRVRPLLGVEVIMTAYAVTRRGRATWSPLRLLCDRLVPDRDVLPRPAWPARMERE